MFYLRPGVHQDGRYLDVNPSWERSAGWSRAEALGRTSTELGLWPSADERNHWLQSFRDKGRSSSQPLRIRNRAGEIRYFLANAERLDFDGHDAIFAAYVDITDQRDALVPGRGRRLELGEQLLADVGEPGRRLLAQELDDQGQIARQRLVFGEQVGEGLVEGPRDLAEHHHRHIALGALEARQVGQRDARLLGQVLARHAALAAEEADVARQGGEQAGRLLVEAGQLGAPVHHRGQATLGRLEQDAHPGGAEVDGGILWCVTELVSKAQLDKAVSIVKEVLK